MIKISALFYSFLISLLVSLLSYFYVTDTGSRGFPLRFAQEATESASATLDSNTKMFEVLDFTFWVFALDLVFWWLLFSILLVVVKNYVIDGD